MTSRSLVFPKHHRLIAANRRVSQYVTFNSLERPKSSGRASTGLQQNSSYKLRVSLLKSPSHFGHHSSRVNRLSNEDKYSACVLDLNDSTVFNFNIFDGHGGDQCSTFLQGNLSEIVESSSDLVDDHKNGGASRDALLKKYASDVGGYWRRWYKHRDQNIAKLAETEPQVSMLDTIKVPRDDLMLRLPMAHLAADYKFFNEKDNSSGSTCTSVYFETVFSDGKSPASADYFFSRNTISKLTVAQVGDTKAILVDRNGEARALTEAHHPSNPVEAARLRRYSASYFMTDSFGEERFISVANTRAFGDISVKEMGVTAEPEVAQYILGDAETIGKKLTPEEIKNHTVAGLGGDEAFLILCTDGVSNELTDQEVADIVMANFNLRGHIKATPQSCAEEVVKFVEYIGGDDNATCLVIRLNGWGKWPIMDRTGELRQERLNAYSPRDRGTG